MKVLITGASGFVGTHLRAALESEGSQAIGLSSNDLDLTAPPEDVARAFLELLCRHRPDVVIHLAGPKPYANEERCQKICVSGTAALLEALRGYGAPLRLVAAGSSAEYGDSDRPGKGLDEETEPAPRSPYGKAKLAQTEAIVAAGGIVLRLFNCLGPFQATDVVAGRIVAQLARGSPQLVIRELKSQRDFLDVRDAAAAFVMAARGEIPAGIYNVCSGKARSIAELLETAIEVSGISPRPEIEVECPEYPGSFQCGDPSKLEGFGWKRRFDLRRSLLDALEAARAELSRPGVLGSSQKHTN
jgi:nucleoside-diphosphate-sugar epimerase